MPCRRRKATYTSKKAVVKHGHITYGKYKSGARKFRVYRVKSGWRASKKKRKKQ